MNPTPPPRGRTGHRPGLRPGATTLRGRTTDPQETDPQADKTQEKGRVRLKRGVKKLLPQPSWLPLYRDKSEGLLWGHPLIGTVDEGYPEGLPTSV